VIDDFQAHQADVLCLAATDETLYASGFDPTIVTFAYRERSGKWAIAGQSRIHTHDVVGLVITRRNGVISASRDAALGVRGELVYPFQNLPPVATSARDGQLIVVGGSRHTLSIWRFDGHAAYQEVKLKVNEEMNFVETVAISKDSLSVAYSASCTRGLRYDGTQWQFEPWSSQMSTSLCFSEKGRLYRGSLDGVVRADESSIKVAFPVFKLAISPNGEAIAAGGLDQIVILPADLSEIQQVLPSFSSRFSTFAFQPSGNRIFIGTSGSHAAIYNFIRRAVSTRIRVRFGKSGCVAMNTILFDPQNGSRVLLASSRAAVIRHLSRPEVRKFSFPYTDILFIGFPSAGQLVIFEKPWIFLINTLPKVVRMKRFLTKDEEQRARY
jgi:WD40 repeat protein